MAKQSMNTRSTKDKSNVKTIVCSSCGQEKEYKDYYNSIEKQHEFTGKMHMCKKCMQGLYEDFVNDSDSIKEAVYKLCQHMSVAFINEVFDIAESSKSTTWKIYFQKKNSLPQYKHILFSQTEHMESVVNHGRTVKELSMEQMAEAVDLFGVDWEEEDYLPLYKMYKEYYDIYEHDLPVQRNLYMEIAISKVSADKERRKGNIKLYNDLMKAYRDYHNDANIKPIQSTGSQADDNLSSYGKWIEDTEKFEPADYFEDKPLFEDFDNIMSYWKEHIIRPFAKIFGVGGDSNDG